MWDGGVGVMLTDAISTPKHQFLLLQWYQKMLVWAKKKKENASEHKAVMEELWVSNKEINSLCAHKRL